MLYTTNRNCFIFPVCFLLILDRMQVTYLGLEGKYFLLLSDAGSQSFMFIYTLLYPISKGISPRLPFNCSLAE